jgi:hypothetical protein
VEWTTVPVRFDVEAALDPGGSPEQQCGSRLVRVMVVVETSDRVVPAGADPVLDEPVPRWG